MLDIRLIVSDTELVKENLKQRSANIDIDTIVTLDIKRRELIQMVEELKRNRNTLSAQVGKLMRENKDASEVQEKVRAQAGELNTLSDELSIVEVTLREHMLLVPNLLDDSVPFGKDEKDNVLYKSVGEPTAFSFTPKAHWDLVVDNKMLDFERGTKIAKSRFTIATGNGAKLVRALINFMMDLHSSRGYTEILPPYLLNKSALEGAGQLPKFAEELFTIEKDELYLIPTAEVPLTTMYSNEILNSEELPLKYTSYSACFRREAGSYGQDVRGYIRQHQFDKVELMKFTKQEQSMDELEEMLEEAEEVLKRLKLPYRVMTLSSGDIGFAASKTYDIEVWLPGQNTYREISSCSNCKDFQARRANIRYKNENGKNTFAHTLNGSGLAVGRTLVAIVENYQQEDGSIVVPDVLVPYMGNLKIISAE